MALAELAILANFVVSAISGHLIGADFRERGRGLSTILLVLTMALQGFIAGTIAYLSGNL